jgi:hypothetical protein
MARWIAFDQETSTLLRNRLAPETTIATFGRGALDYALAKPGTVVTLLPSIGADASLAVFRPPRRHNPVAQQTGPVPARTQPLTSQRVTRASGFLGLGDEPVFDEETVQEKKGWWRRFWDE